MTNQPLPASITTAGANRVLCLALHTAQIQGFFNIPVDHLYAKREVAAHVRTSASSSRSASRAITSCVVLPSRRVAVGSR